jgi:hypothetical protein
VPNQAARTCIGQHVIEFHGRKPRVEWDRDHAQPGTRIDQFDVFTFIREEKGQPVSSCKTVFVKRSRNTRNTIAKLSKSRAPPAGSKGWPSCKVTGGPA